MAQRFGQGDRAPRCCSPPHDRPTRCFFTWRIPHSFDIQPHRGCLCLGLLRRTSKSVNLPFPGPTMCLYRVMNIFYIGILKMYPGVDLTGRLKLQTIRYIGGWFLLPRDVVCDNIVRYAQNTLFREKIRCRIMKKTRRCRIIERKNNTSSSAKWLSVIHINLSATA